MIKLSKKKFSISEVKKILKKQKMIISYWNCSEKKDTSYQNYYLPFKKIFKRVILFDPRQERTRHGLGKSEDMFISLVKNEKPDYIFTNVRRDGQTIETMTRVKEISPETKILAFSGDDDQDFEPLKRYQALFVDCTLVGQVQYLENYHKEGVKNTLPYLTSLNTDILRPMNLKKIYDVMFLGKPSKPRFETLKFLIDNGINVRIFGKGWENYPEIKKFYFGHISMEEKIKTINQSKICLSLSKNKDGVAHFKGRVFGMAACKAFTLVDYFKEYLKFFKNNEEIVMFKDDRDLLEKIKYYLTHDKEREKIADNAHRKYLKENEVSKKVIETFKNIIENPSIFSQKFPEIRGRIITLKKEDMKKNNKEIKELATEFDYISFSDGNSIPLKYKDYLQAYSLEKTKKKISCCDYYVYDKMLGEYLMTNVWKAFNRLKKCEFNQMLSLNQIMVSKNYFLKNINKFRSFFNGKIIESLDEKNTCFISIPLVKIARINKMKFEVFYSVFEKDFILNAYFLMRQKKLFVSSYFYKMLYSLIKKPILAKTFIKFITDKKNLNQLKSNLSN